MLPGKYNKIGLTPDRPVYMGKRHKKRAACERLRRSGPDSFFFHDKREPSGLRSIGSSKAFPRSNRILWRLADFSSIKKTLWRLAGLSLDKEKPSGARLALTGPNWAQWLLRQNRADQERAKIRRASPVGSFPVGSRKGRLGSVKHHPRQSISYQRQRQPTK